MPNLRRLFRDLSIGVVTLAVVGGAVSAQSELPEYEIVDLGTFGSPGSLTYSTAYGLNEQGDVVGAAEDDNYATHAFLYRGGELIDVGALTLEYPSGTGKAVNVHGQVAGRSTGWSPYWKFPTWVLRPFLGTAGGAVFDPAPGIGIDGEAFGINDRGQMAVTMTVVPEYRMLTRAYFWDPETGLREIEFPLQPEGDDAESTAWAINQHGRVAGAFVGQDLDLHAYIWDPATNDVVDLHNALANGSGAYALNERGDAAGWFEDNQLNHFSVVWTQDGRIVSIPATRPGLPSGTAEDVNNLGDVVGWDSTQQGLTPLAWVAFDAVDGQFPNGYPESIALIDLLSEADRAEWELWYAYAINDARQIVGIGLHNGLYRAYLMTPDAAPQCDFAGYPGYDNEVAARAVLELRGADGPMFAAPEDYDRAARDLARITAEHPYLDPALDWYDDHAEHTRLIICGIDTAVDRSEFDDRATCHQAAVRELFDGDMVFVDFPEPVNPDAMVALYVDDPSVRYCETTGNFPNIRGHHISRDYGNGWWQWEIRVAWGEAGGGRFDCDYTYRYYTHVDRDTIYPAKDTPDTGRSRLSPDECGTPDPTRQRH